MFSIDSLSAKKLGAELKKLRLKKDFSYRDVFKFTDIDVGTLSKLENGSIARINPLILTNLGRLYNINPLFFYKLISYTSDQQILDFCNTISNIENHSLDSSIEIFTTDNILSDNQDFEKEFIQLPDITNTSVRAWRYSRNFTFIYDYKYLTLNNKDLGIFKYNNSIIPGEFWTMNKNVAISDYFSKNVTIILQNDDFQIIGKINSIIQVL